MVKLLCHQPSHQTVLLSWFVIIDIRDPSWVSGFSFALLQKCWWLSGLSILIMTDSSVHYQDSTIRIAKIGHSWVMFNYGLKSLNDDGLTRRDMNGCLPWLLVTTSTNWLVSENAEHHGTMGRRVAPKKCWLQCPARPKDRRFITNT